MFDFKDDIITDRRTKELFTLQEMLRDEAIKHSEAENELKKTIEVQREKINNIENEVRKEYEKKIAEITEREEELLRTKAELQAKMRLLQADIISAENRAKLRDEEFSKIQQEKDVQVRSEIKHLTDQIEWLRKKLNEESSAHTGTVNAKNSEIQQLRSSYEAELERLKREVSEKEQRQKDVELRLRSFQEEKNRREADFASQIRELTAKIESLNNLHYHEREIFQKDVESKKQEIQALRDGLMSFQVKSESSAAALKEEFSSIKNTFDSIVKSLENQVEAKQKNIISLERELANARASLAGHQERLNSLVVELEREKAQGRKQIAELTAKISALQTSAQQGYLCSTCGAPVEPNASGCPSCGAVFS